MLQFQIFRFGKMFSECRTFYSINFQEEKYFLRKIKHFGQEKLSSQMLSYLNNYKSRIVFSLFIIKILYV
jgi:hypothetical protein